MAEETETLHSPEKKPVIQAAAPSSTSPSGRQSIVSQRSDKVVRGTWNSDLDFAMSCIAYAVGLGNVWRFPYLCFKNGGGAFLIPYSIALVTCGIPLFLLEVSLGQYLGVGGSRVVGQLCPLLKGVGFASLAMVFLENVYYIIIVAWTLLYIIESTVALVTGRDLPWTECGSTNSSWFDPRCQNIISTDNSSLISPNQSALPSAMPSVTPVESYWNVRVLGLSEGIDDVGTIDWELLGYTSLAWLAVFLVVCKGLHSSTKIVWFSAMFPYVILSILAVKSLTLDGAFDGLAYLFTPDWDRLSHSECWIDGGTQIFYSYGVGIGALTALGSYNKFGHNCYRDTFVVCTINTFTSIFASTVIFSILGYMAHEKGVTIDEVVASGPGLAFLAFPEAVLQLTPSALWAVLFFLMLLILGFDSQFCILEALVVGLVDGWPNVLRPRRVLFTAVLVVAMLLLDIPMLTNGGAYVFQLMDFYAASGMPLLWTVFFQTIAVVYCFGGEKIYVCIQTMIGRPISRLWIWCWKIVSPTFMIFLFVFYFVKYEPIQYGRSYSYPWWGEVLGFSISTASMIWIPAYIIYYLCNAEGSIIQRIKSGLKPHIKMRPDAPTEAVAKLADLLKTDSSEL